jgi:hypothetical protein
MTGAVANDVERYFFVHLQKTAGTTMRQRLMRHFGDEALYPSAADNDIPGVTFRTEVLREQLPGRVDRVRVVSGHFPLCSRELFGFDVRTFTLLREPVERTLSYLRHHRKLTPEDAEKPLEQIYDDPFRFNGLAHNHMTKMLSLTLDEMTEDMLTHVEFTPERVARAKAALEGIDVVGVQDRFEDFCLALNDRFGWSLADRPRVANRTDPVEVSAAFRERIASDQWADAELYEFARTLAERHHVGA